ncbi:MAG TPA: MFS transporter [Aliidongia sp.]|nr:MFS transporter [Aliidongia sp.]
MAALTFLTRPLSRRGRVVVLLGLAGLWAGLDRDGLVDAVGGVRDFLRMPNDDLEIAFGAFGFGFYLALIGGGPLAQWLGARRTLLICGITAAAATTLTGFAWSLTALMLFRLTLGLAAGAIVPASVVALLAWIPPPERGWAQGMVQAGLAAGGILAWPIVTLAEASGSWRAAFPLFGLLGAAWVMAWFTWFESRPNAGFGAEEMTQPPLSKRAALGIMALPCGLAFAQSWGMELCRRWLPRFLIDYWHFDIKLSPTVTAIGVIAPILGCLAGGLAADMSIRHSGNIRSAHQLTPGVGFFLAAFSLLMMPIGENEMAIALWLGLALFGLSAAGVLIWVVAMDVGGAYPGIAAAFIGVGITIGRLLSPYYLGQLTGMWQVPFFVGVPVLVFAGFFSFWLRPHVELPLKSVAAQPMPEGQSEGG